MVTSAQLALSKSAISKWVRAGRLHRKYRGVYAYGHPHLAREGHWMAAVLAAGDGAALAGLSVAALWRITKREPDQIDVMVPKQRRAQPGFRIRFCRHLDPRDVTVHDGIPVTTVARTLVDLTDDQTADELAHMIHEAAFRRRFNLEATLAAMARANGRHNLGVLEEALRLHLTESTGTRSGLERRFLALVRGAGLADPAINVDVNGFEVDFSWPGLCVEVDGGGHARPTSRAEDRVRDAALRAAGLTVLRFSEDDITFRPAAVLAQLAA